MPVFQSKSFRVVWVAALVVCFSFATTHAQATPEPVKQARKIIKQTWYKVESPNVVVVTDVSEKLAIRITQNLEKFRAMVALLYGSKFEAHRPVKVFVTRRKATYKMIISNQENLKDSSGFFVDRISGNYAALHWRSSVDLSILFHEYTHYLTANARFKNYPFWYNEAFAEFLGQVEFKGDDEIYYGKPASHHLRAIRNMRWANMEDILTSRSTSAQKRNRRYQTYSQGWLMVHYFNATPERYKQLAEYLRLTQSGLDEKDALLQATGLTFEQLDKTLKKYAKSGRYYYSRFVLEDPIKVAELVTERLKPDEVGFQFGEFFLQTEFDQARAKAFFDESVARNNEHVGSITGLANIALIKATTLLVQEASKQKVGKTEETNSEVRDVTDADPISNPQESRDLTYDVSQKLIDKAKSIDPNNPFTATTSGHLNVAKRWLSGDEAERKRLRNMAVRDYNRAIKSGGVNTEAIWSAAYMYANEGNWDRAVELFAIVLEVAPTNYRARTSMVDALLATRKADDAETIANIIRNNNHLSDSGLAEFEKWYESRKLAHQEH